MHRRIDGAIRRATPADAGQVAACLDALGYGTPATLVAARLAQFAESAVDAVFVAGGPPGAPLAGVVSAHALPLFHTAGQLVRVTAMAVRPDARGQGIGRALLASVEGWAWAVGARRIEITSGDHRPGAHAFYQAVGYGVDERRFVKHAPSAPAGVASVPTGG